MPGGSGRPDPAAEAVGLRFGLGRDQRGQLAALLEALAAEADPPTTVREADAAASFHLADSLAALALEPVRAARRLVDVGAGAGFPGLPLAVALPDASVDLLEAGRRKTEVIERLAARARVTNARAVHERAESWAVEAGRERYDLVTARAVASLAVLVEYAAPLLRPGGALVAWKGRRDAAEERAGAVAAARVGLRRDEVLAVEPFAGARDRHLHLLVKVAATPPGFPRRPGRATKRPLA